MNLLVSDYDGTLMSATSMVLAMQLNLHHIKKFREAGNKFMLSTGRCYDSIKSEIGMHNIEYDYLSCADGTILYDSNGKRLAKEEITIDLFDDLSKIVKDVRCVTESEVTKDKVKGCLEYQLTVPRKMEPLEIINSINDIVDLDTKGLSIDYFNYLMWKYFIIKKKDVSKATMIEVVSEMEKIDRNNIFTIGDNYNDLEMIQQFNGYSMLLSPKRVRDASLGSCREVHMLIKKINNDSVKRR